MGTSLRPCSCAGSLRKSLRQSFWEFIAFVAWATSPCLLLELKTRAGSPCHALNEHRRGLLFRLPLCVGLVGGVDEEVRLFYQLVHRVLVKPQVGPFVTGEEIAAELVAVVLVPEDLGIDEAGTEFLDD